jgi:methyl-accepting chemotaxis protein
MTPTEWVVVGGFVLTVSGAIWRQATTVSNTQASAKAARAVADEAKKAADAANEKAESTKDEFARYREYVAREYLSGEALRELVRDLKQDIKGLGDRFDKFISGHGP